MLLEEAKNNPSFKDKDIQEEVDTFMFEGHDTLASGAVFSLYMLGCHPEVQSKVQHEIDSVLGNGDSDREVTMEDINQLTYTDCFIKETLRLYPPLPWFGRVTSEPCTIGGCDIPTGSIVTVMVSKLHRDPEFFPDPEKFDPERWLDDKMSSRHPFCYLPFSAGIRNCIGQRFALLELKTILCHILRQYNINCSVKPQHITVTAFTTLKPLKPVLMQLTKRLRNVSS
jgi:cytochrome P450